MDDISITYAKKGTKSYIKINIALFLAGFTIFSILYYVQPLMPYFVEKFNISETEASLSLSVSTITLAIAMLLYGAISEVFGRKPIMIFSVISVSILALIQPFTPTFEIFLTVRLLQGFCLAGLPALAMAYLSEEIHPSDLGKAIGLYISGNAFGGAFGRIFTSYLASIYGYEIGLLAIAILSCISTVLFISLIPNSNNFKKEKLNIRGLLLSYIEHLKNIHLVRPFILGLLLMGGNVALFNYISFDLIETYGISKALVSFIYLLYLIGIMSSILSGRISDFLGRFKSLEYNLLLFIVGALITLLPSILLKIIGLGMTTFAFFSGHSMASAMVGHRARHHTAQATSLYLLFYYIGTSVGGTLGGVFYSIGAWTGVVILAVLFMLIALYILFSMKD